MPRTNGIAESRVKEVLSGARVLLRQAGLEAKWWPYAVRAYCIHKNMRESEDGDTPYKKRHGDDKLGIDLLPFGCLVDLLPIADKPRRPREGISDEQVKADEEAEEERVAAGDEDVSSIAAPAVKAKFDPPTSPGLHLGYAQLPGKKNQMGTTSWQKWRICSMPGRSQLCIKPNGSFHQRRRSGTSRWSAYTSIELAL